MKHFYGAIRNSQDIRDFHIRHYFAAVEIPPAFNFVADMPTVRSQGKIGSCVAFASAYIQSFLKSQLLGVPVVLSPRFIYYETLKAENRVGSDGIMPRDAANTLLNLGVCEEGYCPYGDGSAAESPCESAMDFANAMKYEISSYAACTSLGDVEQVLAKRIPVLLAMPVFQNWEDQNVDLTGEIPMPVGDPIDGHGIAACGYDETRDEIYFENSWGESWAPQSPMRPGFGILPGEYVDQFLSNGMGTATVFTDIAPPAPLPPDPAEELILAEASEISGSPDVIKRVLYRYPLSNPSI